MGPKYVLLLWVKVDQGVMAIKGYSTLPKASGLDPYYWMQFSNILRTSLFLGRGMDGLTLF